MTTSRPSTSDFAQECLARYPTVLGHLAEEEADNRTLATCKARFDNIVNFQGFPGFSPSAETCDKLAPSIEEDRDTRI